MQDRFLLYDTFNAKYLTFQEVSESFVSNDEFYQLTSNNSMLLMGSRGCGKTTLLKMLTPAGLHYWTGDEAQKLKSKMNFTAVYVPSDIQWKNQFDYLNNCLKGKEEFVQIITQFLFASNVQIALCKTFNSVLIFGAYSDEERIQYEYEICKSLVDVWRIEENTLPTFDNIELQILDRVRTINSLVKKVIFTKKLDEIQNKTPEYVFDNYFDLTKLGCKVFEQQLSVESSHKWALCFDELEIVPKFIQLELITFLRSVDQKFIFKLTTTPLFRMDNTVLEATQGNDFSTIKLWVYDEAGLKRWQVFCNKLLINRFDKIHDRGDVDLELIFGKYSLDEIIKDDLNELSVHEKATLDYNGSFKPGLGKGSAMNYLFKRLAARDKSFRDFLEKRSINPEDPYSNDKLVQKSIFLKYKVDAIYRLIYRGRTRKTPPIHFGIPYIFDICDGNPRLVIGLIDEIFQNSKLNVLDKEGGITKQEQSKIIYNSSEKYFNLIKNHPDSTIVSDHSEINLATDLLEKVGDYMLDKIVQEEFSMTSPSTIRVDDEVKHRYLSLLETALSLGALIYLDPIESLSNTGIVGKRFRLSNFLTPKFKIPNRISSEVRLSTLLRIQDDKRQPKLDL